MSTSLGNINSFKRNIACISIPQKTVTLGLLTPCCGGSVGAGAIKNGAKPMQFRD